MAVKIDADYSRSEMLLINPADVLVDQKLNGRAYEHDEETISRRCDSFEQVGQLQPVVVRKVQGNKVQLVMGYCRHAAAMLYNQRHPETPMKLKAIVSAMNDEEAFQRNVIENTERKATSVVDDAINQRRFREEFGWKDKQIAELYNVTTSYLSQLKKLLGLRKKVLNLLHKGVLALGAALQLCDLSTEDQDKVLAKVKAEEVAAKREEVEIKEEKEKEAAAVVEATTGEKPKPKKAEKKEKKPKVKTSEVSKAVRETVVPAPVKVKTTASGETVVSATTATPRTLREIKEFLAMTTGPAEHPKVKYLCESFLKFIAGTISDSKMSSRLDKLFQEGEEVSE